MINKSLVLNSDSYKFSQAWQYPPNTEIVFSYIESRGGLFDSTVFFGLQMFLQEYMTKPITHEDIELAAELIPRHGLPFNREGWEYILKEHGGRLPLRVRAVPEGTVVPVGNVLVTIENTDPECYWLTSFAETAILRGVWYPTTVASNSFESRKIIRRYLDESGTPESINFKLHDFGARGVSSFESAGIGGLAHLATGAQGTDTVTALLYAREFYDEPMAGYSIPAMEHSTVTSWGMTDQEEIASYRNMLTRYGKPNSILAAVSDSRDIYRACEFWGTELKQQVIDSGALVVIRPDSGDPATVVTKCLKILDKFYGHTMNEKGYKVLNNVRIIQGDGIDHDSIRHILFCAVDMAGYSADNIAFGQGGALLQRLDRDTMKFAMKCSAIRVNGVWRDVYKDPITDKGKRSKRGRVDLYKIDGEFVTLLEHESLLLSELQLVYLDGLMYNKTTLQQVRARCNIL